MVARRAYGDYRQRPGGGSRTSFGRMLREICPEVAEKAEERAGHGPQTFALSIHPYAWQAAKVVAALAEMDHVHAALQLVRRMARDGLEIGAYVNAVRASGGGSRWAFTHALLADSLQQGYGFSARSHGHLMSYTKAKTWRHSLHEVARLKVLVGTQQFILSTQAVCSSAMTSCAQALQWKRSLELARDFDASTNGVARRTAHSKALRICTESGLWEQGLFALRTMTDKRLVPSSRLTCLVTRSIQNWPLAAGFLAQMQRSLSEPGADVITSVIGTLTDHGQWAQGNFLLWRMHERGVEPDVITHGTALRQRSAKSWSAALVQWSDMQARQLDVTLMEYNMVVDACEKGLRWRGALEVLRRLPEQGYSADDFSYASASSACLGRRQWRAAVELVHEMRRHGVQPNQIEFCGVSTALARESQWAQSTQIWVDLADSGVEVDVVTHTALVHSLPDSAGLWQRASSLMVSLLQRSV